MRRSTRVSPIAGEDLRFHFQAATFAAHPEPAAQSLDAPQAFLIEPDPSLIAAELVGAFANRHALATLGAGSIYLSGDAPVASPLVANFAVTAELPLRAAAVAKHLASKRIGTVEIKIRGVSHSPEAFRRSLKLQGDNAAVVFLTRSGRRETALIAERLG